MAQWTPVLVALCIAGCTERPVDIAACRLVTYTTEQLEQCACTRASEPDGVLTALAAPADSYAPHRLVTVSFDGEVVEVGATGGDGSLAMMVAIPGRVPERLLGIELEVAVEDDRTSRVKVDGRREAFLERDSPPVSSIVPHGGLSGAARVRPLRLDGVPQAASPITHTFVANIDRPTAIAIDPEPALGASFGVSIEGVPGDLVLIGVTHENGAHSGCWQEYDLASCPPGLTCLGGWGELGVERAGCAPSACPGPDDAGPRDAGAAPTDAGAAPTDADAAPRDASSDAQLF